MSATLRSLYVTGITIDHLTRCSHGATLLHDGHRLDVTKVLPAATMTLDIGTDTDNPGTWMFHCHINDHITVGVMTKLIFET